MNNPLPYMIMSPRPCIILCDGPNCWLFVWTKDFEKKHGKYAARQRRIPIFSQLEFDDGQQDEAVRPDGDRLQISGKALMQLLRYNNLQTQAEWINRRDLRLFFEGNALNSAERYFDHVIVPLFQGTDGNLGSKQRWSINRERTENADFWRDVTGNW